MNLHIAEAGQNYGCDHVTLDQVGSKLKILVTIQPRYRTYERALC
jgi:hypothetical protein